MNQLLAFGLVCFISVNDPINEEWKIFKETYNKAYGDYKTEKMRKDIFIDNSRMIRNHNEKFKKGEVTFGMGMNEFGDLNHEEFLKRFSIRESVCDSEFKGTEIHTHDNVKDPSICQCNYPQVMNTVHNQKDCRSGWAYSMADAIAGRYHLRNNGTKQVPFLSAKYLIHCSKKIGVGNCGCQGGEAALACDLVKHDKKMPHSSSYNANDGCKVYTMENTLSINIRRCQTVTLSGKRIPSSLTNELRKNGPMSAFISADQPSFQFAKEGIYSEENCDPKPNHEVLLVGYNDTDKERAHWIVKNSFGSSWGDNGFLKIFANVTTGGCRILSKRCKEKKLKRCYF